MNPIRISKSLLVLIFMVLGFSACTGNEEEVQRFGLVSVIEPSEIEQFEELQNAVPQELAEEFSKAHIQNYLVCLKDLNDTLVSIFTYFEYIGRDFESEMIELRNNQVIQEWKTSVGQTGLADILPCSESMLSGRGEEVFYFKGSPVKPDAQNVQPIGMVIGLRAEYIDSYTLLHKYTWPEVLDAIDRGNIRNYSIYLHQVEENYYLFSYFEYVGDNFSEDMASIDKDPATIAWIKFTDQVCQLPIPTRAEGEWWALMDEIYNPEL
jgi:L-rhamnose mutarotase